MTNSGVGNKKWVYLFLMVLSFTVTFMTRFIWSPLISTVTPVFGMTSAQAGAYMSAFYIGYVITQIPGGVWADKFGVKLTLSISLLIGGLATVSMSLVDNYSMGFALRVLTGIGAGSVMACCTRIVADYFEQKEQGVAFGIILIGPTLGLLLANNLGAALLGTIGWQGAFRTVGFIAVATAAAIFIFVKSGTKAGSVAQAKKVTFFGGVKAFFSTRNLIGIGLGGFFYMFLSLGTATWANAHLAKQGFAGPQGAGVMMLYSLGGILGSLSTGYIVKKFNLNQKHFLMVVFALISIVTVAFGKQTQLGSLKVIGFLFGFCSYLPNAHLNAVTLKYTTKELSASVMGVQNFIFQIASILSPTVLGWTIDMTGNFSTVWYSLGASPIIGILFLMIIKDSNKKSEAEREVAVS